MISAHQLSQVGPHPPPFPTSWFRLCWSSDIAAGPIEVASFGRSIRVGRSQSTQRPHAADACCAAQQSSAPFSCAAHNPRTYRTEEELGTVLIWFYHVDSTSAPAWELPSVLTSLRASPLVYHGHTVHRVACHCQVCFEHCVWCVYACVCVCVCICVCVSMCVCANDAHFSRRSFPRTVPTRRTSAFYTVPSCSLSRPLRSTAGRTSRGAPVPPRSPTWRTSSSPSERMDPDVSDCAVSCKCALPTLLTFATVCGSVSACP